MSLMQITPEVIKSMAIGHVHKNANQCRVNSIDFYKDGDSMVAASDDGTIELFKIPFLDSDKSQKVFCKKYGADLIRFTHYNYAVLTASNSFSGYHDGNAIRYLSLHENAYIRNFVGHTDRVTSLSLSPRNDTFISAGRDGTIRMWDLRTPNCQAILNADSYALCASIDGQGVMFGAAFSPSTIKFFDFRSLTQGAFTVINTKSSYQFTSLKFSNDGDYLLVNTREGTILVFNAFNGAELYQYSHFKNDHGSSLEASFTPDSKYLLAGSEDGLIYSWSLPKKDQPLQVNKANDELLDVAVWGTEERRHAGPVGCVQWNPKYMMAASACSNVAFWLPNLPRANP
jgi:COMPASS component SWD2